MHHKTGLFTISLLSIYLLAGMACQKPESKMDRPAAGGTGSSADRAAALILDMNNSEAVRPHLREGWCATFDGPPGGRYLWAVARQSSIQFNRNNPLTEGDLIFFADPFLPDSSSVQELELLANGTRVESLRLSPGGKIYRLPVAASFFREGQNTLTFRFAYAKSPRETGKGPDDRTLAAMFKRIEFIPRIPSGASLAPPAAPPAALQPPPAPQASRCLDLAAPEFASSLRSGWKLPVGGSRTAPLLWAAGPRSELDCELAGTTGGYRLILRIQAGPGSTGQPGSAALSINGKAAGRITLPVQEQSVQIDLPAGLFIPGINRFTFDYGLPATTHNPPGDDRAALFKRICLLPLRPLQPGDNYLDFSRTPDIYLMLLEGWHDRLEGKPGSMYLWAVSDRVSVQFYVEDPRYGGSLNFLAIPIHAPGKPAQTAQLSVNGHRFGQIEFLTREEFYSIKAPAALLKEGVNRFDLQFGYSLCPAEEGRGTDTRHLSVMFKRIFFVNE